MSQDLNKLIARLETVTNRLEAINAGSFAQNGVSSASSSKQNGVAAETFENLPSIAGFDEFLNGSFKPFTDLSAKIGNDVKSIVDLVGKALRLQRSFLIQAAQCVQPGQDVLVKFFQTFSKQIEEIQNFREKNRKSDLFNHLSAISESIGALGWIAIAPAPCPYIKEMIDSAQFYTNRVLKDYKEKDPNHVNWVKQWLQLLNELQAYVKQHHTTGVSWNSSKKSSTFDASKVTESSSSSGSAAPAPPAGPLPPPPPPMPNFSELLSEKKEEKPATDALFAAINKGSDITKGLKAVSDDQKTHKNPQLRAANTVPGSASTVKAAPIATAKTTVTKPPVFELDDKKWKVEYQVNNQNLVIDKTDLKHTVYVYQCKECTITVKGKINSILIDSCSRVALLFDSVLSTVEFINSQNVQTQVLGNVPTITIERTHGCQVYLSKDSLTTEIVSSNSTAMNILIPDETTGDFTEHPVPEQFKTKINPKTKKLETSATESV